MRRSIFQIFVVLAIVTIGCTSRSGTVEEVAKYLQNPDNGLMQSRTVGDVKMSLLYKPSDLLFSEGAGSISVDSIRKKYSSNYYFVLSLSSNGREALNASNLGTNYTTVVETLSFRMHEFVKLTTACNDTVSVGDYVLGRTFELGNSTDVLFAFRNDKVRDCAWLEFNIKEFGMGLGDQKFKFALKDIQRVPEVQL